MFTCDAILYIVSSFNIHQKLFKIATKHFQEKNVNQSMHDPRSLNFENVTHLINHLVEISGFNLDQLNDSSDRHISESQFHDLWAEAESINEIDVLK